MPGHYMRVRGIDIDEFTQKVADQLVLVPIGSVGLGNQKREQEKFHQM